MFDKVIEEMNRVDKDAVDQVSALITDIDKYCGAVISDKEVDVEEYLKN